MSSNEILKPFDTHSGDATDVMIVLPHMETNDPENNSTHGQVSSSDFVVQFRRSGRVVSAARKVGRSIMKGGRNVSRRMSLKGNANIPRKDSSELTPDHAKKQWENHERSYHVSISTL